MVVASRRGDPDPAFYVWGCARNHSNSKGLPNWKSYFWRGLFFGFLFFPIVLVLLYQVLKYEPVPITNQAQIRPPNIAVPQTARSDGIHAAADIPSPVSFQADSDS